MHAHLEEGISKEFINTALKRRLCFNKEKEICETNLWLKLC